MSNNHTFIIKQGKTFNRRLEYRTGGDEQQIDLKNKDNSAWFEVFKIQSSNHVFVTTLLENHRHPAVAELLELLK